MRRAIWVAVARAAVFGFRRGGVYPRPRLLRVFASRDLGAAVLASRCRFDFCQGTASAVPYALGNQCGFSR